MPTARRPCRFASCPTTLPTAPLAALTATVSPGFASQIRLSPYHAVTPGIPTAPRYAESGTLVVSTLRMPDPSEVPYSCQPNIASTVSPGCQAGLRLSTTTPAVPPCITSSNLCG